MLLVAYVNYEYIFFMNNRIKKFHHGLLAAKSIYVDEQNKRISWSGIKQTYFDRSTKIKLKDLQKRQFDLPIHALNTEWNSQIR